MRIAQLAILGLALATVTNAVDVSSQARDHHPSL